MATTTATTTRTKTHKPTNRSGVPRHRPDSSPRPRHRATNPATARSTTPERRYVLQRCEFDELIALLENHPGEADETMLLEVLDSLYQPVEYTDAVRTAARTGAVVVFQMGALERWELRRAIAEPGWMMPPRLHHAVLTLLYAAVRRAHS